LTQAAAVTVARCSVFHFQCLTSCDWMEAGFSLVFDTGSGEQETRVFTEQPFGIHFRNKMPIIIKGIREGSQAEQLEVQVGWKVHSIGGEPLEGLAVAQAFKLLRQAAAPLRQCMVIRRTPWDGKSIAALSYKLGSTGQAEVVPYLKQFRFNAQSPRSWEPDAEHPVLRLGMIDGHRKHCDCKHTWYVMVGKLAAGVASSTQLWQVERRLAHIRAFLHDPVKQELGNEYKMYFETAPFAHVGGPPGTTARMGSWLKALSKAINVKILSPTFVAAIIRFMETPSLDTIAGHTLPVSEPPCVTALIDEGKGVTPLIDEGIGQQKDEKVTALIDEGMGQQKDGKVEEEPDESITSDVPDDKSVEGTDEEARVVQRELSLLEDDEMPML